MLFRKKIDRNCLYCRYSTRLNEERLLCAKKGVVPVDHECRRFRYDPFKCVPSKPRAVDFSKYDADDFSL